jgi:hypothetical protein
MQILTAGDAAWLGEHYPGLQPNEQLTEARGTLTFAAAYDALTDSFAIQRRPDQLLAGSLLTGTFIVVIRDDLKSHDETRYWLPRLHLEGQRYPNSAERHFNADGSACLHGPSEEAEFLRKDYEFLRFLEELCVPFLYGQLHVDQFKRWPWPTYNHDAVGVLESYAVSGRPESLPYSWVYLCNKPSWPVLRAALTSRKRPHGHMPCICGSRAPIRSCHAQSWAGLKKMYGDMQTFRLTLPPNL